MAQEILFRRNSTTPVYSNEEAAWNALNNTTHKAAQPVVAFYNKSNTIGGIGDSSIAAVFGIGTADGKGKYQGFASQEDFLSIYSEYANFKDLWNQMFELVEIEQADGAKESFIKAKLSLFSLGEIISGGTPDGEDGEVLQGSLATLRDVSNDGEGNVVIHGTSTPVSNGCIFTFQNGTWAADTESTFVARIKQTLLDSGIASVDYVDTAIANAIADLGSSSDIQDLKGRVTTVETNVAEATRVLGTVTIASVTSTDANVREAYQLKVDGVAKGSVIKIYKDSALQEVYLGSSSDTVNSTTGVVTKSTITDAQSLNFVYQLANGTYSITKIDVSKFLTQSEFGNGLAVSSAGVVSVKVDSTSQSNLTVGANGIKLSGVAQASDVTALQGRKVSAGAGLSGGGDLSADRTISMGTPSTITDSSTNSVSGTTHSHAIDEASTSKRGIVQLSDSVTSTSTTVAATANAVKTAYDKGATAQSNVDTLGAKQITAGNGLTGGGKLSSSPTINVAATDTSIVVAADGISVGVIDGGIF